MVTWNCNRPDYLANPSAKTTEIRCVFGGETLLSYVAGAGLVWLSFLLKYTKHFFFSVLKNFLVFADTFYDFTLYYSLETLAV